MQRLVAASSQEDAYIEFTGVTRLRRGQGPTGAPLTDRPTSEPAAVGGTTLGSGSGFGDGAPGGGLGRSATVPPPRNIVDDTAPRAAAQNAPGGGLSRSKTTLAVASDARERTNPTSPGLQRSMTGRAGPGGGMGGGGPAVTRGLSVRKTGMTSPVSPQAPPPPPEKSNAGAPRLTEIYDGYIGGFEDGNEPPLPQAGPGRVAAWARSNANPANTPSRAPSTRAPSAYGSGTSVGSMRRRPTRRPTVSRGPSRAAMSAYEEEEEGYVSG